MHPSERSPFLQAHRNVCLLLRHTHTVLFGERTIRTRCFCEVRKLQRDESTVNKRLYRTAGTLERNECPSQNSGFNTFLNIFVVLPSQESYNFVSAWTMVGRERSAVSSHCSFPYTGSSVDISCSWFVFGLTIF